MVAPRRPAPLAPISHTQTLHVRQVRETTVSGVLPKKVSLPERDECLHRVASYQVWFSRAASSTKNTKSHHQIGESRPHVTPGFSSPPTTTTAPNKPCVRSSPSTWASAASSPAMRAGSSTASSTASSRTARCPRQDHRRRRRRVLNTFFSETGSAARPAHRLRRPRAVRRRRGPHGHLPPALPPGAADLRQGGRRQQLRQGHYTIGKEIADPSSTASASSPTTARACRASSSSTPSAAAPAPASTPSPLPRLSSHCIATSAATPSKPRGHRR